MVAFDRARSIYERALHVDSKNATVYQKYVEMEMKHKNIALARNLFDRIVTILPRRDQFWYVACFVCFGFPFHCKGGSCIAC